MLLLSIPLGKTSEIPKRTNKRRSSVSAPLRRRVLSVQLGIGSTQINDIDDDLQRKVGGKNDFRNVAEYSNFEDESISNKMAEHLLKMIQKEKEAFDKLVLQRNTEFEARNSYLQNLAVELMDKEEMLLKKRVLLESQELELLSHIG